jgi:pimeloyl-ACP methyl ester carboxylesterase
MWPVDSIEVHASLTRPAGQGPFPAIVIVAGSGPTDRNWNTPLLPGSNDSGAEQLEAYDRAVADFVAGQSPQLAPTLLEGLRNLILSITQPANLPFACELWVANPLALLAAVTVPVLILIGKKDIQVDWQTDGPLFAALRRHVRTWR